MAHWCRNMRELARDMKCVFNLYYCILITAFCSFLKINKLKVKCSRYRLGVAQRAGRGIALPFHDGGTTRGWVVRSTPLPQLTPRKGPVPILQEAGWAPGPVWTGGKSRPHRDSIPDRPARSQSLYRLSYKAQIFKNIDYRKMQGMKNIKFLYVCLSKKKNCPVLKFICFSNP